MELIQLAEILIEKIKKDYSGDVSLVHVHGSYAYNDTHNLSDLDIFFVPRTERGHNLGCTFILNGIGCDFWNLSWDRLERIANHEERIVSLITEGKILYYYSDEDLDRFNQLKQKALDFYNNKRQVIQHIDKLMKDVYKLFFDIQKCNTITEIRKHSIDFIYKTAFILSEINGVSIKRGRKYLKHELTNMPIIPQNFSEYYDGLFKSLNISEIKKYIFKLTDEIVGLIEKQKNSLDKKLIFHEAFEGWYEECVQSYNKITHACEIGDIYTPLFASVEYTAEIEDMFKRIGISPKLPDMVGAYDPNDLSKIADLAKKHQEEFVKLLKENNIKVREFKNLDEVKTFLDPL